MSDISTNLVSRPSSKVGVNTVQVFTMDDFPPAVSGQRTLVDGVMYRIYAGLTTSDTFLLPPGSSINIRGDFSLFELIEFTGTGSLFNGSGVTRFEIDYLTITITNPASTAFNVFGDLSPISDFTASACQISGGVGTIAFMSFFLLDLVLMDSIPDGKGMVLDNCVVHSVRDTNWSGTGTGSDAILKITGQASTIISYSSNLGVANGNESFVFVSPGISPAAQLTFNQVFNLGTGDYFEKNDLGEFTSIVDGNTVSACDSVNSGLFGVAVFNFALGHLFATGDQVTHTGFTAAGYLGEVLVTVLDANSYTATSLFGVPVFFDNVTGGTATLQYRVFATTDTTGIVQGEPITIKNTVQNNGSFIVRRVIANTSFSVPAPFTISEAGTWTTDSLDETEARLNVTNCGDQRDSASIALGAVNESPTLTTPAVASVYQAIVLSGFGANVATERFILSDAASGTFTYIGATRFQGFVNGAMAAVKTGSTQNYRFAMSTNGGIPLYVDISPSAVTSVSDSPDTPGRARFNHALTSPPIGSFPTMSGFSANPRYNVKGRCIASGPTYIEMDGIDFGTTDTGSFTAPAANYIPMEVKTTKVVIPLIFSAILDPGDTIQLMVAGEGTTNALDITDLGFGVF